LATAPTNILVFWFLRKPFLYFQMPVIVLKTLYGFIYVEYCINLLEYFRQHCKDIMYSRESASSRTSLPQ